MTAIDFPNLPQTDDIFTVGERSWRWDGSAWISIGTVGPVGPTGPATSISIGQVLTTGPDESSSVSVTGPAGDQVLDFVLTAGPTGPTGPLGTFLASATEPISPSEGDVWFNSVNGNTYVYYDSYWVGASGGTAYADWSYVNSNTVAKANQNFIADSSIGAFTIILPESPQIGEFVGIIDLEKSFRRNGVTLSGGEELIEGRSDNLVLNVDKASVIIQYVGSTSGWRVI
jgi:hypothetical protein